MRCYKCDIYIDTDLKYKRLEYEEGVIYLCEDCYDDIFLDVTDNKYYQFQS
jgi:uncharacterized protein YlaI